MPVDATKIHQGPGVIWLGVKVPAAGKRLVIDANGNPTETGTVSAPAAPVLSSIAGGSLAAQTPFVKITYVNASGETSASPESSSTVALDNFLIVQSPPPTANAIGYNVYASETTNTEVLQNTAPIPIGENWTQSAALVTGTAPPPVTNTTAAVYGGAIDGATTFGLVPKLSAIKADQIFGAIDYRPVDADGMIDVTLEETDLQKLNFMLPGSAYSTGTDTSLPAGFQSYQQVTYGGLFLAPHVSVAVISPRTNFPGKFVVSQLYQAAVTKTPQLAFSKEKPTLAKMTLSAIADPTRAAGDQMGSIYWQV